MFFWNSGTGSFRDIMNLFRNKSRGETGRIFSWIFFDFANTIYSFIVVTYYLPPLLEKATGSNFLMSFSNISSMLLAGFSAPVLGSLTDRSRAAKKWLIITTAVCCTACVGMGVLVKGAVSLSAVRVISIFLMFVIANYTYQVGLMFYNSFLPSLGTKDETGRISGLGVAFGYAGPLLVIWPAGKIALINPWLVFPFAGIGFLLFSLPMFLFVPEREPLVQERITGDVVKREFRKFLSLFRSAGENRNFLRVLVSNFFAIDAVNTAILFLTTYLVNAAWTSLAPDIRSMYIQKMMFWLIIFSIAMSFFIGWLCDRMGAKKGFLVAVLSMIIAVLLGVVFADAGRWLMVVVPPFAGAGLGGIWTSGRKMVADITPKGKEGEYYGLYGLVGKVSAIGTIFYALITWLLPLMGTGKVTAYKAAILFQCLPLLLSLFFVRKVRVNK
jgi:MFS transporter, UMF1 family